jgi:Cu+-exporting ATPase
MDEERRTDIDPVCGMTVETEGNQLRHEHDERSYYFCSRGCLLEFRDEPAKYLSPDYKPMMLE